MIFKILTLLPVLSLLRCKAVCKSWKSIISDPHFIQAHLTISHKKQPPFSHLRVVSQARLQDFFIDTQGENSIKLTLPDYMSGMYFYVHSCNDLVTLADIHMKSGVFYIWNPLTRLFKLIPKSNIFPEYPDVMIFNHIGLGFDSVSNDYKIFRLMMGISSFNDVKFTVMVAELYSVKDDCWKEIRVPEEMQDFHRDPFSRCVCVGSGVLYFQGLFKILSFDLHDKVFRFIEYPDSKERMSEVLDFDGSIAMILKSGGEGAILSLWKLDGVGGNSWTKMFNIQPDPEIDSVFLYLGDGQFLAEDSCGFRYFYYDDRKKGNLKRPPVAAPVFSIGTRVYQFSGSLVSLEGFVQQE
ncbi:F-box protein CPR1-like [Apium graveolens]|uniref:F-box protein CPR1-like n=1 Tax=Apium graveolens TaxID=4045 RepID=UPI003D7B634F